MADKEMQLLEAVELRLGLANGDEAFAKVLEVFLAPMLLKLESPSAEVKGKVLAICSHVNKRLKSGEAIRLPVASLLGLLTGPRATSLLVKNFALIYLETGFKRMPQEESAPLLPQLVLEIASRPIGQAQAVFQIMLPLLGNYSPPKQVAGAPVADPFQFARLPEDAQFLLSKFLHLLLYNVAPLPPKDKDRHPGAPLISSQDREFNPHWVPAGLSKKAVAFITNDGKAPWVMTSKDLKALKLGVIRFITIPDLFPTVGALHPLPMPAAPVAIQDVPASPTPLTPLSPTTPATPAPAVAPTFFDFPRFLVYLVGSIDSAYEVVDKSETELKRLARIDWESQDIVDAMYTLYLGSPSHDPDSVQSPALPAFKSRLLAYLCKSRTATNTFPGNIQVMFDALYGEAGLGDKRLRSGGMAFCVWCGRMSSDQAIAPVAPVLLTGLIKLVKDGKGEEAPDAESLRGFAYEAIGILSKRAPTLFSSDPSLLWDLFTSVSTETKNVRVSVQDALSSLIPAYKESFLDETSEGLARRQELERVLTENLDKIDSPPRYSAIKYATSIFPFSYPLARYFCIVGSGDPKLEVKELSKSGLQFPKTAPSASSDKIAPSFHEMTLLCTEKTKRSLGNVPRAPGIKYIRGYTTEAYSVAIEFLRKTLIFEALWESSPATALTLMGELGDIHSASGTLTAEVQASLRRKIALLWGDDDAMEVDASTPGPRQGLLSYLELLELGLNDQDSDAVLQGVMSGCLLELVSLGPRGLGQRYASQVSWIRKFVSSSRLETRQTMSHLLGIVSTADLSVGERRSDLSSLVDSLLASLNDTSKATSFEMRHGAILSLGFIIGRLTYRHPGTYTSFIPLATLNNALRHICMELDSTHSLNVIAGCVAIGEASRYTMLPLEPAESPITAKDSAVERGYVEVSDATPEKLGVKESSEGFLEVQRKFTTKTQVREKLVALVKSNKEAKVREAAVGALGYLCVGWLEGREAVLDYFYETATSITKDVELHFAIGDALCCLASQWSASNMTVHIDISDVSPPESPIDRPKTMEALLKKILNELIPSGRPQVRKACVIWLLCLIKYCGSNPAVQESIMAIHQAFGGLLADRDEFTQEVASKGIGLVYELGNESVKAKLVQSLVDTFTEGRKLTQTVTPETQLFEGNLGQAPDGTSLSTYQSILSLASDLNQPDLVYKFMNLASHSAMWNSRRGATMGFSSIMIHAEEALKPHLSILVPKLYRFQFDPSPKVSESMKSIWRSLIKEPKKAIDEYFNVIIKDLLEGMGNRLWRTRESSCTALGDLLIGRKMDELRPYLTDMWSASFRALDDIKESVRIQAFSACKVLTAITVKYCDPSTVSIAEGSKIMSDIIPFFLTKGLGSSAEDVKRFSMLTLLKLCKTGGVLLKPHLTELIATLLEALSGFEDQRLNYLSFHTEKYKISQEQLESGRVAAAKASPMMEGIENVIQYLDDSVMETFIPRISQIIRRGVGLPTKAGAAKLIVSIIIHNPSSLKRHADNLLSTLRSALTDRSPVIRQSSATAIGYISHLTSPDVLVKLLTSLKAMYLENLESGDEDLRSIPGICIREIAKRNASGLREIGGEVFPLTYLGTKDPSKDVAKVWLESWEDLVSAPSQTFKLYLDEFMTLLSTLLASSQSWLIKKQVGGTVGDLSKAVEPGGLAAYIDKLIGICLEGLAGRTWDGKEKVLEALVGVCRNGKDWFLNKDTKREEIRLIILKEAKKNNQVYKAHAIQHLGDFYEIFDLESFSDVYEYLVEMSNLKADPDDMDIDSGAGMGGGTGTGELENQAAKSIKDKQIIIDNIRGNALRSLVKCFPTHGYAQDSHGLLVLQVILRHLREETTYPATLLAAEVLNAWVDKIEFKRAVTEPMMTLLCQDLLYALEFVKFGSVREELVKTFATVLKLAQAAQPELISRQLREQIKTSITSSKEGITLVRASLSDIKNSL